MALSSHVILQANQKTENNKRTKWLFSEYYLKRNPALTSNLLKQAQIGRVMVIFILQIYSS